MVSMSSTLVETVSINYEDFNESFLTCGTCLCMYDGSEHTPKLLPCSHTVCLHCLTRIAASQTRDTGSFRCPICRELINIPRGGVSALPPSFLVNQLLDLMSRQRREVIPKCSVHLNQELLFCETCDTVFCTLCTGGSHSTTATSGEHTIIPFSIAIKRMSEILLYKANECISKLSQAQDTVSQELRRLDLATEHCLDQVNRTFQEVSASVERRRQEMVSAVGQARDEKRKVLEEQLTLIEGEKTKVGRRGSHRGCFNLISSVTVGHGGEIVVADSRIQVFSAKGDFIQQLFGEGKGKGRYGGVVVDGNNRIIATRSEKNRNYVQVLGLDDGSLVSTIDSHESKLKRPSGMAITSDRHVIVVDLGNNCIKKYRYW